MAGSKEHQIDRIQIFFDEEGNAVSTVEGHELVSKDPYVIDTVEPVSLPELKAKINAVLAESDFVAIPA